MSNNMLYKVVEDGDVHSLVEEPAAEYGSQVYTYADYLLFKIEERIELIRGKILKMSGPNTKHQVASRELFCRLYNHLRHQPCKVFSAPFDVRLPVKNKKKDSEITTVVQPDIMVVCDTSIIDERGICGAPDLIVEILSPSNSKVEVKYKFELYEEAGVKEYWIVNPNEENIIIYHLTNGKFIAGRPYASDDIIESKAVKGFSVLVDDIFEN